MESKHIARFVSIDYVHEYVLVDRPTFCLNSTAYYRDLANKKGCACMSDRAENELDFGDTRYTTNEALISCWSLLKNRKPTSDDWNYWQQCKKCKRSVAVVSTISQIRRLLQKEPTLDELRKGRASEFKDQKVLYDSAPDPLEIYFYKRKKFERQREYRFAFRLSGNMRTGPKVFPVRLDYIHFICPSSQLLEGGEREKMQELANRYEIKVQEVSF